MPKERTTGEHHPRSRKAEQLFKKNNRSARLEKKKHATEKKQSQKAKVCQWVKANLEPGKQSYTTEEIHALIGRFLDEKDAQYEQKKKQQQHKKTSTTLELRHYALRKAYNEAHFEMPDLTQANVVQELRKWNGDRKFLQNFKLSAFSNPSPVKAAWEQVNAEKKQESGEEQGGNKQQEAANKMQDSL